MPLYQPPSLRVALGLGDQELEQRLRPALDAAEDLSIVAQCLAADHVLELVQAREVDAVVVAWSLHRLTDALLDELERPGVTVLLLVPDAHEERWQRRRGPVLGLDTTAAAIHEALLSAGPGVRSVSRPQPQPSPEPLVLKPVDSAGGVIAVTGGAGSPGRTTVAINLAAALGVAGSSVLVEADLTSPSIAAYLDRDPSRNVCTLAHTVGDEPRLWSTALEDDLQPLGAPPLSAQVLCGPPKREMRTSVAPALMERLIDELARRFRWVIIDVGPELLGMDLAAANHRAALGHAHHVLLVGGADLVGLWHARSAIEHMERSVGLERRRLNLVLNRYDARFHHSRQEIEWHLGLPTAAVIPFDHVAAQRSVSEQRPLILDTGSRAARALWALAEALNDGKLRLPVSVPSVGTGQPFWRRMFTRHAQQLRRPSRTELQPSQARTPSQQRSRAW